jgi:hypothetical protein
MPLAARACLLGPHIGTWLVLCGTRTPVALLAEEPWEGDVKGTHQRGTELVAVAALLMGAGRGCCCCCCCCCCCFVHWVSSRLGQQRQHLRAAPHQARPTSERCCCTACRSCRAWRSWKQLRGSHGHV